MTPADTVGAVGVAPKLEAGPEPLHVTCILHLNAVQSRASFSATHNLPSQSLLVECATIHFALFGGLHTLAAKENCNPTPPRVWCSLYVKSAAWVTASVDVKMFTLNSSSAESAAIRREGHCDLPNNLV